MNNTIKICLCAIFRNENKNVNRCLNAAKPVIDFVSICDTGSTDNTRELIKQWGIDNNIPTKIHSEEFINFGQARSLSLQLAKQSFPDTEYFLLIDADHILQFSNKWNKSDLIEGAYMIKQINPFIEYWNTRLIKADMDWTSIGVTHEYWSCPNYRASVQLDTIWIYDQEDGGYKSNKFERDRYLLITAINDPNTPEDLRTRYYFYLAQTYRDLNNNKEAIYWYDKRVSAGGWEEEVYVAQCEKAKLLISENADHNIIISEHLKAFTLRPSRAETLFQLASYCRSTERYAEGYIFAKIGKDIPMCKDILFVQKDIYEWQLLDEFSICAYWIGQYEESKIACEKIINLPLPSHTIERITKNLDFVIQKLS